MGYFEFLNMLFELKVGPSKFQRFISVIFKELTETGDTVIYLDDILVASETLEHYLKALLQRVIQVVRNRMELRLDKYVF